MDAVHLQHSPTLSPSSLSLWCWRLPLFNLCFFTCRGSPCSHQYVFWTWPPPFILLSLTAVAVFSLKGFGTSGASIMHSHNQLLTARRSSRSRRLVSSPDPYMSPSLFPSAWALCSSLISAGCLRSINLSVGPRHRLHRRCLQDAAT